MNKSTLIKTPSKYKKQIEDALLNVIALEMKKEATLGVLLNQVLMNCFE